MGRRYGGGDIRHDYKLARSRATDSLWRADDSDPRLTLCEQTEHEERVADDMLDVLTESVAQVAGRYIDPDCRFLRHPAHTCHDREGQPLRPHTTCWVEARAQIQEQGAVLRAAGEAVGACHQSDPSAYNTTDQYLNTCGRCGGDRRRPTPAVPA